MDAVSDVGVSLADYREMVNASFTGGIMSTAKVISIGVKMVRDKAKRKSEQSKK